jgi:hypothetical protein
MRNVLLLLVAVLLVSGCVQDQPTGQFLANQLNSQECISSWNCSDWSSCLRVDSSSGLQNRICTDINSCQVESARPGESRTCSLPGISMVDTSKMILTVGDLPGDGKWNVTSAGVLPAQNVTANERSLGYVKGYYSNFNSAESMKFYHRIGIYPMVSTGINMTFDTEAARSFYKVGSLYENTNLRILSFSVLPSLLIGDYGISYNITAQDGSGNVEVIYTICFTKLDVADVVTIQGSQPDYSELVDLARKAEAKIV